MEMKHGWRACIPDFEDLRTDFEEMKVWLEMHIRDLNTIKSGWITKLILVQLVINRLIATKNSPT